MNVAVSLGLYLSERNKGPFHNALITFSESPAFQVRDEATLYQRVQATKAMPWGMSTNLEQVFVMILKRAVKAKLAQEDMPATVLILSDMQFNQCVREPTDSALRMIKKQYEEAGYTMPNVVFWNLRTSYGVPAKQNERGVSLVSGFSPSIMKTLLTGVEHPEPIPPTPMETMLATLNSERYDAVVVA
jgi:hypothetical protein